jgi:hypothetical protein
MEELLVYDRLDSLPPDEIDLPNPKWVSRHQGDRYAFRARHHHHCKWAWRLGIAGLKEVAPSLFRRMSDERNLRLAWDHLAERGGPAPGPDGLRYSDLDERDVWKMCRWLRDMIREGEYEPGREHVRWISKGPGRGQRPIVLQSILDRVVQRAVVEVVQPLLDPLFTDHSLGYRPNKGRLHALALAERYVIEEYRSVWVIADIKDAFLHVPLPRLLQVVQRYLPATDIVSFIGHTVGSAKTPGLRQGGALSPLLLNLYLHHFLDRPWRKEQPHVPLIRVADDILLLCRTVHEAQDGHAALAALLRPAGMPLKGNDEATIHTLSEDDPADWLGFQITKAKQALHVGIGDRAWDRLVDALAVASKRPDAADRVDRIIRGWVSQMGPCYSSLEREQACDRLSTTAHEQVRDGAREPASYQKWWQIAHARWCRLRNEYLSDVDAGETITTRA